MANLPALALHTQPAPAEVKVAKTDNRQLPLSKAHQEEKLQSKAVSKIRLCFNDAGDVLARELFAFDVQARKWREHVVSNDVHEDRRRLAWHSFFDYHWSLG